MNFKLLLNVASGMYKPRYVVPGLYRLPSGKRRFDDIDSLTENEKEICRVLGWVPDSGVSTILSCLEMTQEDLLEGLGSLIEKQVVETTTMIKPKATLYRLNRVYQRM